MGGAQPDGDENGIFSAEQKLGCVAEKRDLRAPPIGGRARLTYGGMAEYRPIPPMSGPRVSLFDYAPQPLEVEVYPFLWEHISAFVGEWVNSCWKATIR